MEEIFVVRSTNGRWGLTVVGPEGTKFPAQGTLRHVGYVDGVDTFEFTPDGSGLRIVIAGVETDIPDPVLAAMGL